MAAPTCRQPGKKKERFVLYTGFIQGHVHSVASLSRLFSVEFIPHRSARSHLHDYLSLTELIKVPQPSKNCKMIVQHTAIRPAHSSGVLGRTEVLHGTLEKQWNTWNYDSRRRRKIIASLRGSFGQPNRERAR